MERTYSFGYWVRRRRRALDLTQDQLAGQVGCAVSMLKKIERDERRPSQHLAERLAVSLAIPAEERIDFVQAARAERAVDQLEVGTQPISRPSADAFRSHLPTLPTSLIGRTEELRAIRTLLGSTATRLVTLVGVGGIGKTRLALHVAEDLQAAFPDGIWFVDLAPVSSPGLVPQSVATALGLHEEVGRSLLDHLVMYVRAKQAVLILDNCEHLIAACAQLTETLLRASQQLHVLATSREALGIAGETRLQVPPLSTPDALLAPSSDALRSYDAVQLFVDRAAMALPGFSITPDNAAALAHICRYLDGIPLAIELAAARVEVLRVEQIAERLTDMLRLLTGGSRAALPRQQTLRASLDWSYELLTEGERTLLRRVSIFHGGWILEAAEQVASDHSMGSTGDDRKHIMLDSADVLDVLSRLVHTSLVVAVRQQGTATRYRLLEPIREYAREKLLAAGEEGAMRDRHLRYYLGAITNGEHLRGSSQVAWISEVRADMDNVRSALDWAQGHDAAAGLQAASGLWRFCLRHGYVREITERLQYLLEHPAAAAPTPIRAYALSAAAQLVVWKDLYHARILAEASLSLHRVLGDQRGEAFSLLTLGSILSYIDGNTVLARSLIIQSIDLYRAAGDTRGTADALISLGTQFDTTEYTRAQAYIEEALTLCRGQDDLIGMVDALEALDWIAMRHGDFARARSALKESMAIQDQLGENPSAPTLIDLGMLALYQGEYRQARVYLEDCMRTCQDAGNAILGYWAFVALGYTALRSGDAKRAQVIFRASLNHFKEAAVPMGVVYTLEGVASLAVQDAMLQRAVQLFAWAEGMRTTMGDLRPPVEHAPIDRDMLAIHAYLDDEVFMSAWHQGSHLSMEQAIALALDDTQ